MQIEFGKFPLISGLTGCFYICKINGYDTFYLRKDGEWYSTAGDDAAFDISKLVRNIICHSDEDEGVIRIRRFAPITGPMENFANRFYICKTVPSNKGTTTYYLHNNGEWKDFADIDGSFEIEETILSLIG